VNIIKSILNIFLSKESKFNNLEARNIMIDESNFNKMNLTLGNTFKVNGNIKIKNFKEKITEDNLTVVVINNKGKTIGYITKNELINN
jgi:predicted transcriptional regulator|tara:strand:+ start:939 stop:1202 length:264 start_codon:yes stop_codon:yes gene_type:complete